MSVLRKLWQAVRPRLPGASLAAGLQVLLERLLSTLF